MLNAGGVGCGQTVGDTYKQFDNLLPLPRHRERPLLECPTVDELCDQIRPCGELASIMNCEDVRMVKRRHHLSFALKPPSRRGFCSAFANEFDSDWTVELCINGFVHN